MGAWSRRVKSGETLSTPVPMGSAATLAHVVDNTDSSDPYRAGSEKVGVRLMTLAAETS